MLYQNVIIMTQPTCTWDLLISIVVARDAGALFSILFFFLIKTLPFTRNIIIPAWWMRLETFKPTFTNYWYLLFVDTVDAWLSNRLLRCVRFPDRTNICMVYRFRVWLFQYMSFNICQRIHDTGVIFSVGQRFYIPKKNVQYILYLNRYKV